MDFVAKIVGNYTTISSYEDGVFTPDPFVIGVPNGTKLQNLTVHAKFIQNKCTGCGEQYNLKLQIIESRPTFENIDKELPTLVVWHGWASPRGSFDFRLPSSVENFILTAPHYFEKNTSRMYYFLLEAGTTFEVFETRRYYNKELWTNWVSFRPTGVVGHQESDGSTLLWVDGPLVQLTYRNVEIKETVHKKCREKWAFIGKVGCTDLFYLEKEDERFIKYNDTVIKVGDEFVYHRPEIEEHKDSIQTVLGQADLTLLDKCEWVAEHECDNNCESCNYQNSWKIVPA